MNALDSVRDTMRKDRVWDFMVKPGSLELDITHGTIL